MGKDRTLPVLAAISILLMTGASAPAPAAYFVASGGRDTWSGRLPAPNATLTDGPFATLAAAQSAMRAGSGCAEPCIRLTYMRQGSYYLRAPVRFGDADAGERILAYPGEHPVLYGGLPVGPAPMPIRPDNGLPILLSGNHRLGNARLPLALHGEDREDAWFFADSSPGDVDPHRSFRVRAGDKELFAAALPGSWITIFGRRGWQDYVLPIRQIDVARRIITLDGHSWDAIGEGSRFAVLNAATTPGTWRLEAGSHLLRTFPPDVASRVLPIVAATSSCILSLENTHDVVIRGLRLAGSTTEGAAVCLSRTQHVTLDGLDIANTGDGIRLDQAADTRVIHCEIGQTAGFGIVLRHNSSQTEVRDSWLHDIGWLHQDASAIWFDGSSHNLFTQNRIERVAKFGIGGGSLTDGGAYYNVIEGNEIDRVNQRTSDGGGIMVIGWAQDITHDLIRGNFISRATALGNMGWDGQPHTTFQDPVTRLVSAAIYLDDWASGVQVSGNLLCGNIGGIELHAGWNNQVDNNVLTGNAGMALAVDAGNWLGRGAHPHPMENNSIEHNTVILDRASAGQSGVAVLAGGASAARFDNNVYAGSGLNGYSFHHKPEDILSGYSFGIYAWRRLGQDQASDVGVASAHVLLRNGDVRVLQGKASTTTLPLAGIGRPGDNKGLAARVRQLCALP